MSTEWTNKILWQLEPTADRNMNRKFERHLTERTYKNEGVMNVWHSFFYKGVFQILEKNASIEPKQWCRNWVIVLLFYETNSKQIKWMNGKYLFN